MKRILILAALCFGLQASAQRKQAKERTPLTTEQAATLQTKRLALALDLSDAQQKQMQKLQLKVATERMVQRKKHEERRNRENESRPTKDERYAMQVAKLDAQLAHKKEMKSILSETQYATWESKVAKRGEKRSVKMRQQRSKQHERRPNSRG